MTNMTNDKWKMENEKSFRLLPPAFRLLPPAFWFLPSASCVPPSAFCLLPSGFCLLVSAFCLLHLWIRRCSRGAFLIGGVNDIRLIDIERAFAADADLLWDRRGLESAGFDANLKPVAGQLSVCRVVDVAFRNQLIERSVLAT